MRINFIHKNNIFHFDIKEDVSIEYLKNLVNKIIMKKDNSSFDLFYNNKILPENASSLFQIVKKAKDITIIISLKNTYYLKKRSNNSKIKLPLLTEPNKPNINQTQNDIENNLNLNESAIFSNSSSKNLKQCTKSLPRKKGEMKLKPKNYISINKVFEDIYNAKEEEIFKLMKILANKILEYDDNLYKKYKIGYNKDNSQLLLFEKNIIDFKDKQIQFLKNVLNNFDTKESSFFTNGNINLDTFNLDFSKYDKKNKYNLDSEENFTKKEAKINSQKLVLHSDRKIRNINISTSNISNDSNETNKKIKENIDIIFDYNKKKQSKKNLKNLSLSSKTNIAYKNDNLNDIHIEKINNIKQKIYTKNIEEKIEKKNEYRNKYNKEFNNNYNNEGNNEDKNEDKNEYNNEDKNEDKTEYKKEIKNEFKNESKSKIIKLSSGKNVNKINKESINSSDHSSNNLDRQNNNIRVKKSINEIPNGRFKLEIYDKNKINALFEISEDKHENTRNISDNDSKRENNSMEKNMENDVGLRGRKKTFIDPKIKNKNKTIKKKNTIKTKKFGSNAFDFII